MEMVHFIPPSQRRLALLAAQAETAPVLIQGGHGTGKGAIARWIHQNGPRAARPFMTAVREQSLSAQIPMAHGGTLVVPEIGEWGLAEQRILVDYLNTKSVQMPSSGTVRMLATARIITTNSHSLEGRAQAGLFNPELLTKLSAFRIDMPPLSDRGDEFEDIVQGILGEVNREIQKEHLRTLSPNAWDRMRAYEWPGNLRELRNVLRMAVVNARGDLIEAEDLPELGNAHINFRSTREQFEKIYLGELLKKFHGDVDSVSKATGMETKTLKEKLAHYRLLDPPVS